MVGLAMAAALLLGQQTGSSGGIDWTYKDVKKGFAAAQTDSKTAMVYFMADWAAECARFEKDVFADPVVRRMLEFSTRIRIDCSDRDVLTAAGKEYGVRKLPTVIAFDAKGAVLYQVNGYVTRDQFLKAFSPFITVPDAPPVARAPAPEPWVDTHRIHLIHGTVIDCQLKEEDENEIVIRWSPTVVLHLRKHDILKVEKLEIRAAGTPLKEVDVKSPGRTPDNPTGPDPVTEATSDAELRAKDLLERIKTASANHLPKIAPDVIGLPRNAWTHFIAGFEDLSPPRAAWVFKTMMSLLKSPLDEPLIALTRSSRVDLRLGAVNLLSHRSTKAAAPALVALLEDPEPMVKSAAMLALGKVGNDRSLEPLAALATEKDPVIRSLSIRMALQLALALKMDGALAGQWVRSLQGASDVARADLAEAFGKLAKRSPQDIPNDDVFNALLVLLKDRTEPTRVKAIEALSFFKRAGSAEAIMETFAAERAPRILVEMCETLAKLGQRVGLEEMILLLRHDDAQVKGAAHRALQRLAAQKFPAEFDPWWEWYQSTK